MHKPAVIFILLLGSYCYGQSEDYLIRIFKNHNAPVLDVTFSPDGKFLASGAEDKIIYIWEINSEELAHTIDNNYYNVQKLKFLTNDNLLVISGPDIKEIDLNGNIGNVYKGSPAHIWSFDIDKKNSRLICGSYHNDVNIWNLYSQEIVLALQGHEKSALAVCFSNDGKYVATGSLDRTVRLWNAETGEQLFSSKRHVENIYAVAFHPGGKYFVSASKDYTIRLWDVETGEVVKSYIGHEKPVFNVAFTPDGNHLLSCSMDQTVKLWQTFTGKCIHTYIDHKDVVNSIAIHPDGKYFASASSDNTVLLYELGERIFSDIFFAEEIEKEKEKSELFLPKKKNESKEDLINREYQAKEYMSALYKKYYKIYIEQLNIDPGK